MSGTKWLALVAGAAAALVAIPVATAEDGGTTTFAPQFGTVVPPPSARPATPPRSTRPRGRHVRHLAATTYSFAMKTPGGSCQSTTFNGVQKYMRIETPIVYAREGTYQWTYWHPWIYDTVTGGIMFLDWQGAWAYSTTPAAYASSQYRTITSPSSSSDPQVYATHPLVAGMDVWWYSYADQQYHGQRDMTLLSVAAAGLLMSPTTATLSTTC